MESPQRFRVLKTVVMWLFYLAIFASLLGGVILLGNGNLIWGIVGLVCCPLFWILVYRYSHKWKADMGQYSPYYYTPWFF